MSMRSAKSSGKSYVAVYLTNISAGTAESELGFRLIQMATRNLKPTASIPQRVYFEAFCSCPGKPLAAAETGVRFCILLSLTWMG
ncbi:unnamed protein product, partial [Brassica oleracea]